MMTRTHYVKGTNVCVGDVLFTAGSVFGGYAHGFKVESIIDLGHGPFGAVRVAYGPNGERFTLYGTDLHKIERTY